MMMPTLLIHTAVRVVTGWHHCNTVMHFRYKQEPCASRLPMRKTASIVSLLET